ncbi:EAL domain-containing protein [Noviherbaspirillum sp. UKPF54]|uniref:EAL domain-containing protein n=1 Tax=Noviherbaspirillum sp. UKPF54 TaxID=2601898 RepID=UPI00143D5E7B|nr:EAL domain-containing protein [Noviherbaspirillum sp. UKPF54]
MFQSLSLKTKLSVLTICLFAAFIWLLVYLSVTVLKTQFEQVLFDQQFSATRRIAADLDGKLNERIESLIRVADKLPADQSEQVLDTYLKQFDALHVMFPAGITVIGLDGKAIADYPVAPGRRGMYFGDRDYFLKTVSTRRPYIDKPLMGRALKRPVLAIAVPVFDGAGAVRAVVSGITDLTAPNFLGVIAQPSMAGKGNVFVIAPRDNLIVAASEPGRALAAPAPRGGNPMYDRFVDGFEGSGVGTNSRDISKLFSGKRVPTSDWIVMLSLPTEIAYGPLKAMQHYVYVAAAVMTLLAFLLIRRIARGVLAPLDAAGAAMRAMTGGQAPLLPLPVAHDDEVGQLIGNFNLLVEDRHRHEEALSASERRLRTLIESAPDAIFLQSQGRFTYVNSAAMRLFGAQDKAQLVGKSVVDRVHPEYRHAGEDMPLELNGAPAGAHSREARYLRFDNSAVDVEFSAVPFRLDDEDGALVFARDISERKRAEQTQEKLNRALRLLSECNMTLVHAQREQSLLDEICRLVVARGGYRMAWVGYAEDDPDKTVRPMSRFGFDDGYIDSVHISWAENENGNGVTGKAIRSGKTQINQNFLGNPAMAQWREAALQRGYQASIALPLIAEQRTFGTLAIYSADPDSFAEDEVRLLEELATDLAFGISMLRMRVQRAAAEEKLAFLSHHDPLTHLPNRVLLRDRFDRAVVGATRARAGVAMLFLDLDNFKRVNDSLGHDVGDQLLLRMVDRLRTCIGDNDTISRHGGDEFVILLADVTDPAAVGRTAQTILEVAAEPFEIGEHVITTSFSIGISLYPSDGGDFDTLLKHADVALYHSKDSGRDTYHFFANTMNVDALARMQLHSNLRKAVKNGEFLLHYQPQIDIASGRIAGAEALVRWQRPDEGLVAPGRFIPLAEETGLIVQIGEWVLNEACRQAKAWMDGGMPSLVMAVNLSAQQFKRGDIVSTVARALEQSGLPAGFLELELTESILLQDTGEVMETLHSLKKLGVHLSIDDFGTGYSSLSYLKRLAVDKLKIDQSFVRDLAEDADDAAIVKAVIQLGHALQLSVIAEGVETEDQLAFLQKYGCDQAQGYLIARALPAGEFVGFAGRNG